VPENRERRTQFLTSRHPNPGARELYVGFGYKVLVYFDISFLNYY
jgi:hypothetical protein